MSTVLVLIQFLLEFSANEVKLLSLEVAAGFGTAKPYYKQKNGRRQLERLIYHLIGLGIIKEEPTGSPDRPSIILSKGVTDARLHGNEKIFF